MKVAAKADPLETIRTLYGEEVEKRVKEKVGDNVIVDFWFDRCLAQPCIYFRFNGKVEFVRLWT